MDVVISKAGVPVRLTDERWFHIVENHDEVAGYYDQVLEAVEDPDLILQGYGGALIAAYFTSEVPRRRIRWRKGQPWRKR